MISEVPVNENEEYVAPPEPPPPPEPLLREPDMLEQSHVEKRKPGRPKKK
jgi:hypothetical protein